MRLPLALTGLLLISGHGLALAAGAPRADAKVREARNLIEELLLADEKVVPVPLIEDTRCLAVFPKVVEAALGLGGSHGTGIASCRDASGTWSAPIFLRVSGGSIGLQAGFRQVDLLLFVVTEEGAASLSRSSFSFGGEASVAAGRLDRRAEVSTDSRYEEDFYLFARARGLFAGASLEGTRLSTALDRMQSYYGEPLFPGEILTQQKHPTLPAEAELLLAALASLPD